MAWCSRSTSSSLAALPFTFQSRIGQELPCARPHSHRPPGFTTSSLHCVCSSCWAPNGISSTPRRSRARPLRARPDRGVERSAPRSSDGRSLRVGFAHILTHPLRVGSPFAELLRFLRIRHFLSSRPPLPPWHGAQMLRHSDCPQTPTCQGRLARHPRPRAPGACTPS